MKKIIIINGPNLNLLGEREPQLYGNQSFASFLKTLKGKFTDISIDYFQSNIEGELINKIQEVGFNYNGIILNAGGYTHTSVSLRDAIASISTEVVEVHLTNIYSREKFRQNSLLSPVCKGAILGFGLKSYMIAVYYFK